MSAACNFVAYIDESGDEGVKYNEGSPEWFVLGAAIFAKTGEGQTIKIVDDVRNAINAVQTDPRNLIKPREPLHFRKLRHEQKKLYVERISQAKLQTIVVGIHKPSMVKMDELRQGTKLYFYSTRLLLERIGRLVHRYRPGQCLTELCFSNRGGMNYTYLAAYLNSLHEDKLGGDFGCRPGVFSKDLVTSYSAGKRVGLQVSDAVASSYYFALQKNSFGHTEDSYVKILAPKAYRSNGTAWKHGVKIMPKEAENSLSGGSLEF